MKQLPSCSGDSPLVTRLKRLGYAPAALVVRPRPPLLAGAAAVVLLAAASIPFFPRSFLPPFNEGTLTVNVLLNPGTSLAESNRIGTLAEAARRRRAGGDQVGRRTGPRRAGRACRGRPLHRDGRRSEAVRTQPRGGHRRPARAPGRCCRR
jgi:Cu/Ag efflux pump CusA